MMTSQDGFASNLRDQFLLRSDVVFLNHGSFGACPRPVFEAYQQWQFELERQSVEFLGRRFDGLMRSARNALGTLVGADLDDMDLCGEGVGFCLYTEGRAAYAGVGTNGRPSW
jgi:hypothetical protein